MYHIIIADDTNSVRGLIARVVARTYAAVQIAAVADGRDALTLFEREGADLIITNNEMVSMSGLQLITELRSRQATLPIIMISGNTRIEQQARLAGASAFIPKPFSMVTLMQVLKLLLPPTTP